MRETDVISRQAALDLIEKAPINGWVKDALIGDVRVLPSAQPERKRAKWIVTTSIQEGQITWRDYKCSNCSHHRGKPMNFCEVCGAKMERRIYE